MYTIEKRYLVENTIKNSKFITILYPVTTEIEVTEVLAKTKEEWKKATHYCYSYRLENSTGMSDDGEPAKTAGAPMLQVLEKANIVNVLAVTVRYFGGIKLGTGGLIRAYTKGVQEALKEVEKKEVAKGYELEITFPYEKEKEVTYFLPKENIKKKHYDTSCHYTVTILESELERIKNLVTITKREKCLVKRGNK